MPRHDADRNLLFGILALQMGFIARDDLIAAMNAWLPEKHQPLDDLLVDRGALDPSDRALLDPMVDRHVAKHGGDPLASLAALGSAGGLASELRRSIAADPDVLASIAAVPDDRADDSYATRSTAPPEPPPAGLRYRKVREHASGNLGVVYVARDEELNRDVALKEIKERNADHPHSQAKFLLEAEVTGGLEHPGIVPVYGLGHHDGGRPFYAMRFIRGKSLHDAIRRFHADDSLKADPGRRTLELQKLLRRFTDVCNAIAYAHSRGVLHRDLKPDNVMVGKYGETLVVDWGLAKALGTSGDTGTVADPDDPLPEASLQPSSTDHLDATHAGALVGTPAYMSPEQAAGRLDLLGPASDVYGLGATLYHLLVGRPPVADATGLGDLLARVQAGDIPRPRAFAPWLDPALEAICLKAMALKPEARYATARALADDIDRWIAGEPVAAYPEPWTRRARRWARKHRTSLATVATAATVAAVLLGGFAWQRIGRRQRTDASAQAMLDQARRLAIEARSGGRPADWIKAIAEARRAVDQLESGGGSTPLRGEARARLEAYQAEEARRLDDIRTVAALEEALLLAANIKDGEFDQVAKLDAYLAAFRAHGIDVATLPIEDAARRIRSSPIADHLIATLDDWVRYKPFNVPPARLGSIARASDSDPSRAAIRDLVARGDTAGLRRLCEREEDRRKLGPRLRHAFDALLALDLAASLPVLEVILRENPSNFWMNHNLGLAYLKEKPPRAQQAVRCLSVAVALRPESPGARLNLGNALKRQGKTDEAVAVYREAIRLKPDFAQAHGNLGIILAGQKQFDEAIAECREAIRLRPDQAPIHGSLGIALQGQGRGDEAIAAFREAIRLKPDLAEAYYSLGIALKGRGKLDEAIAAYREAIRIKPDFAQSHSNLGIALESHGEFDEAIAAFREAIRLKPDYAEAHNNLGLALKVRGKLDEAIAACRESIRLKPDYAPAHCNLGLILQKKASFREALESLERGHALGSGQPGWRQPSEEWVRKARRLMVLEPRFPAIVGGQSAPRDVDERLAVADLCYKKKWQAASARFYREAFTERPALADDMVNEHRYNAACAASLAGSGSGQDVPPPDQAARAGWRKQALGWLRADLAAWSRVLEGEDEAARKTIAPKLAYWKIDADLAGIRDEAALAKLPEAERKAFRSLWADVEALRVKAAGAK